MPELLKSELLRWRGWALGLGLVHLIGLSYLSRMTDLAQPNQGLLVVIGGVYVVVGGLVGGWQAWGYRRPAVWLTLLHRPVAPRRIAACLGLANGLVLLAMVGLPVALALPVVALGGRPVETWQLGLALQAWMLAFCGSLCAWLALLTPGRWALLLLLTPFLLLPEFLALPWLLLPMAGLLAWLLLAVERVFQPDLERGPRGAWGQVLLVLPAVLALTILLQMGGSVGYQAALGALGAHPQFAEAPPPDSYVAWRQAGARKRLAAALTASGGPALDEAALKALPTANAVVEFGRLPVNYQPGRLKSLAWAWPERDWRLEYSHAEQIYLAFDAQRRLVGRIGRQGLIEGGGAVDASQRFEAPPLPVGPWAILGSRLLRLDPANGRMLTALQLPREDDRFVSTPVPLGPAQDLVWLTKRELILTDRHLKQVRWRLEWPQGLRDLGPVDLAVLPDGWLVSVLEGLVLEPSRPLLSQYHVDAQGQVRQVRSQPLQPSFGEGFTAWYWMVSPLQHELLSRLDDAVQPGQGLIEQAGAPLPRSQGVQLAAALLMAGSALGAALLARRRQLGWRETAVWTLVCGLASLPGLLVALGLMQARPQKQKSPVFRPGLKAHT
ncbi:hypothetical protein [Pelomonas sp. SE-A7]|uniref:hypothetical protein n=1 Tax=Pelomonas sp. SE-A7 TaxID=3054953 RepID=UPI00259CF05E|nr:hypothetical protein [Pelomonas sp. SE-A7]MDM4765493.1 hypothetical protein [Pelomonas sp. SE-A7]